MITLARMSVAQESMLSLHTDSMNAFHRRLYAVVNPIAALGRASRFWPQLQKQLQERIGPFPWDWSGSPMHATSLVRSALQQGYDLIVSVGGDGTHNEVINGFFTDGAILNPRASLAVVPCGTGSDLCRSLGISSGIASTVETILSGWEREVDAGRLIFSQASNSACERLFLNVASLGLSARANALLICLCKSKSISVGAQSVHHPIPWKAVAGGEASGDSKEDRR